MFDSTEDSCLLIGDEASLFIVNKPYPATGLTALVVALEILHLIHPGNGPVSQFVCLNPACFQRLAVE